MAKFGLEVLSTNSHGALLFDEDQGYTFSKKASFLTHLLYLQGIISDSFDEMRKGEHNLNYIYYIHNILSDRQMRSILDYVLPVYKRSMYKDIFRKRQRGKALEQMVFMEGRYSGSLDVTGVFISQ